MQSPTQVGNGVEHLQALDHLGSGNRVLEGPGVMVGKALALEVALLAGLPVFLLRHAGNQPLQNRRLTFLGFGDHRPQVEVDDRDAALRSGPGQALLDLLGEQRELLFVLKEEIDQPPLVDGDQAGLILGPAGGVLAREGGKELLQHGIVALVAFILAAVVVALVGMPLELEHSPIRAALHLCALALGKGLELLNEGRLTVTGVTADDDQAELALEQRGLELFIQIGRHVGGFANFVEATGARVGYLTLAVEGQQVGDKGVGVGLGRLEAQLGHHLGSGTNLAGGQHRAQALDLGHGGQELIDRREAILALRRDHLHQHIDQ